MSTYKRIGRASYWDTFDVEITNADGSDATLVKTGSYPELLAALPRRGDVLDGWGLFAVTSATLRKRPGKMGVLTIHMLGDPSGQSGASSTAVSRKIHLKWREINVGLFDGFYQAFGSDINVALLQCWQSEPDPALKAAWKTNVPVLYGTTGSFQCKYTVTELTGETLDVAKRILAGQTSYRIAMPVVLIVERFVREPIDIPLPKVVTTENLAARFPRIGNNVNNTRGRLLPSAKYFPTAPSGAYQWICFGRNVEDSDKGWTVTWEWQGALPPLGFLGRTVWGANAAFDPKYYPAARSAPAPGKGSPGREFSGKDSSGKK